MDRDIIREQVVADVRTEMFMQIERWGDTSLPSFAPDLIGAKAQVYNFAYHLPTEEVAKKNEREQVEAGYLTWADILLEEICEAYAAGAEGEQRVEEELMQAAGLILNWVTDIRGRR